MGTTAVATSGRDLVVVITAHPEVFQAHLGHRSGIRLFHAADEGRAFALADAHVVGLYVDFALPGTKGGRDFLVSLHKERPSERRKQFVLVDSLEPNRDAWLAKADGIDGVVKRSWLDFVGHAFGAAARSAEKSRLHSDKKPAGFPTTNSVDPWVNDVNEVFKGLAGGIGAYMATSKAMAQVQILDDAGRDQYVRLLTESLSSGALKSAFSKVLVQRNLMVYQVH
jgi:hypothetical protein